MGDQESLHDLLDRWRAGDQAAAADLYRRYAPRLRSLARQQIGPRLRPRLDPDDVMLSVLDTVLRRIARGEYAVDHSGTLWNLLEAIAKNKIRKQAEFHGAGKRDVGREVHLSPDDVPADALGREPAPEEAAVLADELEKIRQRLSPGDFEIFQLQFAGHTWPEIADRLHCARQTVRYKAQRIERLLRQWAEG
jgi:RNA polymerase sigma factor (sigma-70 family)